MLHPESQGGPQSFERFPGVAKEHAVFPNSQGTPKAFPAPRVAKRYPELRSNSQGTPKAFPLAADVAHLDPGGVERSGTAQF